MDFTNEKCVMLIDDSLPLGLIEFPIPILKAPPERIKAIREALYEDEFAYLTVVDVYNLPHGGLQDLFRIHRKDGADR